MRTTAFFRSLTSVFPSLFWASPQGIALDGFGIAKIKRSQVTGFCEAQIHFGFSCLWNIVALSLFDMRRGPA